MKTELYRELPSVDELLHDAAICALIAKHAHAPVADASRAVLDQLRSDIAAGRVDEAGLGSAVADIAGAIERQLERMLGHSLRPVINATGVILHTNLGRAPLAEAGIEHIRDTATRFSNLEFDLATGERGKRDVHVERLFRKIFSAYSGDAPTASPISTIVVNNNAAAVLLAVNTLAEGGEVIVSRGELVEIGGSFRIPDVMGKSGAMLREVGTTNRTRIADYERAINERTRLLLRVHRSNFEITGFTEQAPLADLVTLAQKYKLPVMEDLGSGAFFDLRLVGITNEPGVLDSLRAGVHVVTYSGDKLLGGPQAGLISGREDLVKKMRSNSLFRALRVDKLTYAALESTLMAYVKNDYSSIPTLRMMQLTKDEITRRAEALKSQVTETALTIELIDGESLLGGGSAPSSTLPTTLLAVTCRILSPNELAARLRGGDPPIVARVEQGKVLLDLRTVFPDEDQVLCRRLTALLAG